MIDADGDRFFNRPTAADNGEEDQLEIEAALKDEIEDTAADYRPDQVHVLEPDMIEPPEMKIPRKAARRGLGRSYRSGPKGVRADYEEAKLEVTAYRLKQKIKYEQMVKHMALGQGRPLDEVDAVAPKPRPIPERKSQLEERTDDESIVGSEKEEEDIWAKSKENEIKLYMENEPSFGTLNELHTMKFNEEIDGENPSTTIVIHVYQDYIPRCARMNDTLTRIASTWPRIKFLKGRTDRILPDYPDWGTPSFIVFRGGQQLLNLTDFNADVGDDFTDVDVVRYLRRKGVLPAPAGVNETVEDHTEVDKDGKLLKKQEDEESESSSLDL